MQNQPSILLIDDDTVLLESVSELLELSGYEVITATQGEEGLKTLAQCQPDLIISDIAMHTMDGYEFFKAVRANPKWVRIPFIFLSARGRSVDIRLGTGLGADHYLTKPFESEDLLVAIQSRLKRVRDLEAAIEADVEKLKSQLLAVFGHEFRTPLTSVYGFASLLADTPSDDPEEQALIANGIRSGSERLIRLFEDMMMLLRIDSDIVALEIAQHRTRTELSPLIAETIQDVALAAEAKGIHIESLLQYDLLALVMPSHFQLALRKLLDNAVKFSYPQHGCIRVSSWQCDSYACVSVWNDGIGIENKEQEQIFERFYQIDRDIHEQQGMGIGLSISKGLIDLMNGHIEVESIPGQYSLFTLKLPL